MNLHKLILTENACYKAGRKITPKGIMVHSTGANNPNLRRYVGPDDGLLGVNQYGNHWNQDKPGGSYVCVHGFIGKLADGTVATYQTLPWNWRGWHAGDGSKGSANDTHISFEICEDDLSDSSYFAAVYQEAVELCAYLCKQYDLTEKEILCHSEGYTKGIASNHGDVMHWFPKFGKSMDTFRADVKKLLGGGSGEIDRPANKPEVEEKPVNPAEIKVGSKVKIKAGAVYSNGVKVPDSVIGKEYTVQQLNSSKALLREIVSWVDTKYLTVSGSTSSGTTSTTRIGTCTGDGVRIRAEAHTAAKILGNANKGDKLELLDDDGWGWSKVKANGVTGWMYNDYINGSGRSKPKTVHCSGTYVNLRKSPSTSAKVVRQLNPGDKITLISINPDGWLDVDGGYLYYDKSYLEIK